jgi:hypothetical protein
MGLDRVGSPPGRIVRASVTGRWLRGLAGPYCRAARRRSSWRWRAICCSRYGCIDVGLSPGDPWDPVSPLSRRAGGNVAAWLFFRRRDLRHGRAPWPGPHRGPAGRAAGRHARGARAGPCAGGYGSAALFLISPVSHPSRVADGGSPALLARLFGNNKDCRPRGASPEGAGRVEYRCAAIGHPKVLPGRPGGVRGSVLGRVRGLRPGCGWPGGQFEPPFARGQVLPIMCAVSPSSTITQPAGCLRGEPPRGAAGSSSGTHRHTVGWGEGHAVPIDRAQA